MSRGKSKPVLVSLRGRGWRSPCRVVAVVRLRESKGFAVGVQQPFAGGGTGQVYSSLPSARDRAGYLADLHRLPIAEAL